jgi:hypothetical protein
MWRWILPTESKMFNVCLWLKFSPFLNLVKNEYFSKVSGE